jgi:hypothetical protein
VEGHRPKPKGTGGEKEKKKTGKNGEKPPKPTATTKGRPKRKQTAKITAEEGGKPGGESGKPTRAKEKGDGAEIKEGKSGAEPSGEQIVEGVAASKPKKPKERKAKKDKKRAK